jgi:hypothetical protein
MGGPGSGRWKVGCGNNLERGIPTCGAKFLSKKKREEANGRVCGGPAMANGRCWLHGGKTPKGPANPAWKTGMGSRYVPKNLRAVYDMAMGDTDLLNARHGIALLDAKIDQTLREIDDRKGGALWDDAYKAFTALEEAMIERDADKIRLAFKKLRAAMDEGQRDRRAWYDVRKLLSERTKISESERRRLIEMQQVLTMERASALVAFLIETVRRHVTDKQALIRISKDVKKVLEATPGGNAAPALDAGIDKDDDGEEGDTDISELRRTASVRTAEPIKIVRSNPWEEDGEDDREPDAE